MIYKLGDLTIQRREKYSTGDLPICGVSKDGIIPPKQQEADISIYNVLYRNDFIFNPARMELNSIAFNDRYDKAICSSLYEIFYVKSLDLVLPEYLQMVVKTDNFRRFCSFVGSGSVREYCRYANISDYPIELPSIDEQQKLVKYNKIIQDRILLKQKINDNLLDTAQTIIKDSIADECQDSTVGDIIELFDSMRKPMSSLERSGMERIYPYYGAAALMDYVDDYIFDGIFGLLGEDGTVIDDVVGILCDG